MNSVDPSRLPWNRVEWCTKVWNVLQECAKANALDVSWVVLESEDYLARSSQKPHIFCGSGEGNTDDMSKSAEEAATKITELKAKLEAEKAEKSQLDQVFTLASRPRHPLFE